MTKEFTPGNAGKMVNDVAQRLSLVIEKEMAVIASEDGSPDGEIKVVSAGVATAALAVIGCHMGFKIGADKESYLNLITGIWDWIAKNQEAEDEVKDILMKMKEAK